MRIVPIEEWGGTPNNWPSMTIPAEALWIHHSVTTPTEDAFADFRVLDRIGRNQGHGGISYSYVIHPNGTIGEGQGSRRGAHTGGNGCGGSGYGWNPCSFGVCFVGNYMDMAPTPESLEAFRWLRDVLLYVGALQPGEYPTGGHRDAPGNSTACPGNILYEVIPLLRQPSASQEDEVANMYVTKESDPSVGIWVTDGVWKRHIRIDEWNFISYVSPDKAKIVPITDDWWNSLPVAGVSGGNSPAPSVDVAAIARAVNDEASRRLAK